MNKEDYKVYSDKMRKSIDAVNADFASVRAGRANASVLDRISVDYYGSPTPIQQIAAIASPDPRQLVITPWDGTALKPIALLKVYEAHQAVPQIPIIGMGGVFNGLDALEFMMAGATAVGVGTAIFVNPRCLLQIPREMEEWLDAHNIQSVTEIIGTLQR